MGNVSALSSIATTQQLGNESALGSYRYSTIKNDTNRRKIVDRVLIVVTAAIYRHPIRALIDNGAAKCFVASSVVLPLGLNTVKAHIFLEMNKNSLRRQSS